MADRIVLSPAARSAVEQMQRIINSGLMEQINALGQQGKILSDQSAWDGRMAREFRSVWEETYANLERSKQALEELRESIRKIHANIMAADNQ